MRKTHIYIYLLLMFMCFSLESMEKIFDSENIQSSSLSLFHDLWTDPGTLRHNIEDLRVKIEIVENSVQYHNLLQNGQDVRELLLVENLSKDLRNLGGKIKCLKSGIKIEELSAKYVNLSNDLLHLRDLSNELERLRIDNLSSNVNSNSKIAILRRKIEGLRWFESRRLRCEVERLRAKIELEELRTRSHDLPKDICTIKFLLVENLFKDLAHLHGKIELLSNLRKAEKLRCHYKLLNVNLLLMRLEGVIASCMELRKQHDKLVIALERLRDLRKEEFMPLYYKLSKDLKHLRRKIERLKVKTEMSECSKDQAPNLFKEQKRLARRLERFKAKIEKEALSAQLSYLERSEKDHNSKAYFLSDGELNEGWLTEEELTRSFHITLNAQNKTPEQIDKADVEPIEENWCLVPADYTYDSKSQLEGREKNLTGPLRTVYHQNGELIHDGQETDKQALEKNKDEAYIEALITIHYTDPERVAKQNSIIKSSIKVSEKTTFAQLEAIIENIAKQGYAASVKAHEIEYKVMLEFLDQNPNDAFICYDSKLHLEDTESQGLIGIVQNAGLIDDSELAQKCMREKKAEDQVRKAEKSEQTDHAFSSDMQREQCKEDWKLVSYSISERKEDNLIQDELERQKRFSRRYLLCLHTISCNSKLHIDEGEDKVVEDKESEQIDNAVLRDAHWEQFEKGEELARYIKRGAEKRAQKLLGLGIIDANYVSKKYKLPLLFIAIAVTSSSIVEDLLKRGAEVDNVFVKMTSFYRQARTITHCKLRRWWIERTQGDVTGWTPLHAAALVGYEDILRAVLEKAKIKNPKDRAGNTPLQIAQLYERHNIIRILKEAQLGKQF